MTEISFHREAGFTLVEILISTMILSGLALGAAEMMTLNSRSNASVQAGAQMNSLQASVIALLNRSGSCAGIFQDSSGAPVGINPATAPITISRFGAPGNPPLIQANSNSGHLRFEASAVTLTDPVPMGPNTAFWKLNLNASKVDGTGANAVGGTALSRTVYVMLVTNGGVPDWLVTECGYSNVVNSSIAQQVCVQLGGTFDISWTPPCRLPNCP